jgi:hypothetical protein
MNAYLSGTVQVVCKLGGIQMTLNGFGFDELPVPPSSETMAEATLPYYSHCLKVR